MKEQFDKKLIEKIKISFEDHEEPFNPQEWEKLSHAYFHPAKKKKLVYWPFLISGVAASLLLMFVFWPIGDDLQKNVQTIADSITIEGKQFEKIELPRDIAPENLAIADPKTPEAMEAPTNFPVEETAGTSESSRQVIVPIDADPSYAAASLNQMAPQFERSKEILQDINKNAANEKIGNSVIAYDNDSQAAQQYLEQWKSEGQTTESLVREKNNSNNVRLGFTVGPQTSSNPVAGMSLGAGVMSEFSFSNRLKLDVGIAYASHSMVPDNSLPSTATMDSPKSEMFSSLTNSPRLIGSNAELNFSGLDIPVNLKYKVMDKEKSGLFLITGLSSMVYLNQQTTETVAVNSYFNANTSGDLEFQRSVQEFTHEAGPEDTADGVDLGRMLNLSVGYEYNLKNGTYLSIEPYYKLPLGDMTFANQQFSIGGLNLRMNFRIGK